MTRAEAPLPPGTAVGRFVVERLAGSGAMGDVYAARDTQLGRVVGLKILPEAAAADRLRLERFAREAKLAAAVNDPAVVTVYDSGTAVVGERTIFFLAMEFVDGVPLSEWGRRTRDLGRVLTLLAEVAEGLARAHAGGVVHRDLKPDNIMVARGGHPKIVDFGIAKLIAPEPLTGESDTAPSAALGTAAYMSPEQVSGADVDHRADVFAFGCVMYELLTRKSPFRRGTVVETMHAVLHDTPPSPSSIRSQITPEIDRIVRKCLAKERDERYQSTRDLALDLRDLLGGLSGPSVRRRDALSSIAAALIIAGAVFGVGLWSATRNGTAIAPVAAAATAAIEMPSMERLTNTGDVIQGAVSPDGKYVVYVRNSVAAGGQSMWVKQIATGTNIQLLPPADGFYTDTRVSPNGDYVYYCFATLAESNVISLMRIPLLGGQPREIARDVDGWFSISPDGSEVAFRRFNAIERIYRLVIHDVESSSEEVVLERRPPQQIGRIAWHPDRRHITISTFGGPANKQIFNLDLPTRTLAPVDMPQGLPRLESAAWLPDASGAIVTGTDDRQPPQVWFAPLGVGAKPRKITSDISAYSDPTITADSSSFVINRSEGSGNIWVTTLEHPDVVVPVTTGLGNRFGGGGVRWLPDGRILFVGFQPGEPSSLFEVSPGGGMPEQLTRGREYWSPLLSPDGSKLVFLSGKNGPPELWVSAPDGSGPRQVTHMGGIDSPSWLPDGRSVVAVSMGATQMAWKVPIDGGAPVRLTNQPTGSTRVSPDGKWLLCRLRGPDGSKPLWRTALVSLEGSQPTRYFAIPRSNGGHRGEWLHDSSGFLFVDLKAGVSNLWLQPIDGSAPRQITHFDSGIIPAYDIDARGRIVIARIEWVNDLVLIRNFRPPAPQ